MSDHMLVYPTEKVVGVLDDPDRVDGLRRALTDIGVGDLDVLAGDEGSRQLDPSGEQHGKLGKVVRTVQKALGDEAVRLENLNEELEQGNIVVQAALPSEGDEAREQDKQRIGATMREHGVRSIAFYGRNQIEELTLGA